MSFFDRHQCGGMTNTYSFRTSEREVSIDTFSKLVSVVKDDELIFTSIFENIHVYVVNLTVYEASLMTEMGVELTQDNEGMIWKHREKMRNTSQNGRGIANRFVTKRKEMNEKIEKYNTFIDSERERYMLNVRKRTLL